MNDFEVLSRDVAESGEPGEPKRDVETPEEPNPEVLQELKRLELELGEVRASADCMDAEIDDAIERFTSVKDRVDRLIAENSKLAKALDEARRVREESVAAGAVERELRREVADAQRLAERFKTALDAALNDVAIYRRAAFWFGVSSLLAVGVAFAAAF